MADLLDPVEASEDQGPRRTVSWPLMVEIMADFDRIFGSLLQ